MNKSFCLAFLSALALIALVSCYLGLALPAHAENSKNIADFTLTNCNAQNSCNVLTENSEDHLLQTPFTCSVHNEQKHKDEERVPASCSRQVGNIQETYKRCELYRTGNFGCFKPVKKSGVDAAQNFAILQQSLELANLEGSGENLGQAFGAQENNDLSLVEDGFDGIDTWPSA